ncbi:MAG TPA: cyclic nucleotide-binding domain-containing protein [Elusimicrobiales bacterium]|nr:cyclic nucleotide-binding domain-containing protein [Elusimicrobiales bacterium]
MTERKVVPADLDLLSKKFTIAATELKKTLSSLAICVYEPGAVILKEGEPGTDTYVLLKGRVSVRRSRWLLLSKEVAQLKPGDLFGEIGFLVPTTRSASIVASEQCEVFRLVPGEFKELLERHAGLKARIEEMARKRIYSLSAADNA